MLRSAQHDRQRDRPVPCHAERSEAESKHLIPKVPMRDISNSNSLVFVGGDSESEQPIRPLLSASPQKYWIPLGWRPVAKPK